MLSWLGLVLVLVEWRVRSASQIIIAVIKLCAAIIALASEAEN